MSRLRFAKNAPGVAVKIACKIEPMGMSTHVVMPAIRNASPDFRTISNQPEWSAVKNSMNTLANGASSATYYFMDAFTRAQKDKEERAESMVGPIVRETYRKTSELLSLSSKEHLEIVEELSSSRDEHKENQKQIKNIQTTSGLIQKTIGPALSDVLKSKIDPKTLDVFCKALKTSSRIATQAVPALRVLNHLSLAYDAAKVLYPDKIHEIESYLTNAIQPQTNVLEQGFSNIKPSVNSTLNTCKQDLMNSLDDYEQQSKELAKNEPQKITESKNSLPSSFKKYN